MFYNIQFKIQAAKPDFLSSTRKKSSVVSDDTDDDLPVASSKSKKPVKKAFVPIKPAPKEKSVSKAAPQKTKSAKSTPATPTKSLKKSSEIAKVDSDNFKDLIVGLTVFALMVNDVDIDDNIFSNLQKSVGGTKAFLESLEEKALVSSYLQVGRAINDGSASLDEKLIEFVKLLRKAVRDHDDFADLSVFPTQYIKAFNAVTTAITAKSRNAMRTLAKETIFLGPDIQKQFTSFIKESAVNQDDQQKAIRQFVKKYFKVEQDRLTPEQENKLKNKDPELIKEYRKLLRDLKEAKDASVSDLILDNDGVISILDFVKQADKEKVPYSLHKAFKTKEAKNVYVNANRQLTDETGDVLSTGWVDDKRPVAITFNPDFSTKLTKQDVMGRSKKAAIMVMRTDKATNYIYPARYAQWRKSEKFGQVDTVLKDIDKAKASWRKYLLGKAASDSSVKMFGALAEFLFWTSLRVGSSNTSQSQGVKTFGASKAQIQHIKKHSASKLSITLNVKGNHKVVTVLDLALAHDPDDKKALKALLDLIIDRLDSKSKTDLVFSSSGKELSITEFNRFLKKTIGAGFSAHKFRTMRGTEIAEKELEKASAKLKKTGKTTDKAVNETFMAAMKQVGVALGHIRRDKEGNEISTEKTAIASYINPKLMVDWYANLKIRPPSIVLNAAKKAHIAV